MEDDRNAHIDQGSGDEAGAVPLNRMTGEFTDPVTERRFRGRLLSESGERIGRSSLVLAALFAAFTISDLSTMGLGAGWAGLLAVRLIACGSIVGVAWRIRRDPTWFASAPGTTWLAVTQAVTLTAFLVVCWVRPEDVLVHAVSTAVLTSVLIVFVPSPMRHQVGLIAWFHLAFLAVVSVRVDAPVATVPSLAGLLAASSLTSFTVAANLNRAVRIEWKVSTEQREANELLREEARRSELLRAELHRQATQDPLTGLANRRSFFSRGEEMVEAARRNRRSLTVLLMDADGFKKINDAYGHAAGDAVLRSIGAALSGTARRGELVGRIGGEEFAVVAEGLDDDAAEVLAQRLRSAVSGATVDVDGQLIGVTVSIGFTDIGPDEALAVALGRADRAMYRAKATGGDRALCLAG